MMYKFMTLDDTTEIVHSDIYYENDVEIVKVYFEKPVYGGFHSAAGRIYRDTDGGKCTGGIGDCGELAAGVLYSGCDAAGRGRLFPFCENAQDERCAGAFSDGPGRRGR